MLLRRYRETIKPKTEEKPVEKPKTEKKPSEGKTTSKKK